MKNVDRILDKRQCILWPVFCLLISLIIGHQQEQGRIQIFQKFCISHQPLLHTYRVFPGKLLSPCYLPYEPWDLTTNCDRCVPSTLQVRYVWVYIGGISETHDFYLLILQLFFSGEICQGPCLTWNTIKHSKSHLNPSCIHAKVVYM